MRPSILSIPRKHIPVKLGQFEALGPTKTTCPKVISLFGLYSNLERTHWWRLGLEHLNLCLRPKSPLLFWRPRLLASTTIQCFESSDRNKTDTSGFPFHRSGFPVSIRSSKRFDLSSPKRKCQNLQAALQFSPDSRAQGRTIPTLWLIDVESQAKLTA